MFSTDETKVSVIEPNEQNEILNFLRIHYYREEPLTCGSVPKEQDRKDEEFSISQIQYGTCLKAIQEHDHKVVGVLMAGPKRPEEAEHLYTAAAEEGGTKWGKIMHFLANIERESNVFRRYNVKKVLHAHAVGVDAQMRGKKIAGLLMTELMKLGKQLNYELVTADCTSFYSAKVCERLGWECVNIAYYKDFLDKNRTPVFQPPSPHDCCRTFAARL